MSLVIVDTGCANLASVGYAVERLGVTHTITADPSTIKSADRVILPGVGSAPFALKAIDAAGLVDTLKSLSQPVLGICLGMQLLFDTLTEGGTAIPGLGLIPGNVTKLDTGELPSPHMGWNTLEVMQSSKLTDGVNPGDFAYFVHSYAAPISKYTLVKTRYGVDFSAVVARGHVYGCQFHPERSSAIGGQILKNFSRLSV